MIAPSTQMVLRTLGKHALGAAGALAIVAGAVLAVLDLGVGLALVAAGAGLIGICWGLTGPVQVATPPKIRPAPPSPPGESLRPAEPSNGVDVPRAA